MFKKLISKSPLLYFLVKKVLLKYRQFGSISKWNNLKKSTEINLELGSGPRKGLNGWTTIDIESADINWDLRRGIPLPNECVNKIYSSHFLEHMPYDQLLKFLYECRRVMKAEGQFLVAVPNFRLYINAYLEGQDFKGRDTWYQPARIDTDSAMDQLNYIIYMKDQHRYMFDEVNLLNLLRKAGFTDVRLREFNPTLDLSERDFESIYATAHK